MRTHTQFHDSSGKKTPQKRDSRPPSRTLQYVYIATESMMLMVMIEALASVLMFTNGISAAAPFQDLVRDLNVEVSQSHFSGLTTLETIIYTSCRNGQTMKIAFFI